MVGFNHFLCLIITIVFVKKIDGAEVPCDLSGFSSSLSILEPTFRPFIAPIFEAIKDYSVGNEEQGSGSGSGGIGLPIDSRGMPYFGLPNNGRHVPGPGSGKPPVMPKIRKKRDTDDLIEKLRSVDIPSLAEVTRGTHDAVNWNSLRSTCGKLKDVAGGNYMHFKKGFVQCGAEVKEALEEKLSELLRVIEPICAIGCERINRLWSPLLYCYEALATLTIENTDASFSTLCSKIQDKRYCMATLVEGCQTAEHAVSELWNELSNLRDFEESCTTSMTGEEYTAQDDQKDTVTVPQQEDNSCKIETLVDCFDDVITSFQPVLQPLVDYIGRYGKSSGRDPQTETALQYVQGLKDVELVSFFDLQEKDLKEMNSVAGCQAFSNSEKMESCTSAKTQACGNDIVNRIDAEFQVVYGHLHPVCQEGCGNLNDQLLQHKSCSGELKVDPSDRFPSSEICIQKIASAKECFYQGSIDIECSFIVDSFERLLSELTADCAEDGSWELDVTIWRVELDRLQCGNVALFACFSEFDPYFGPFIEPLMDFLGKSTAGPDSESGSSRNPSIGGGLPGFPFPGSSNPNFGTRKKRGVSSESSGKRSIALRNVEDISLNQFRAIDFQRGCSLLDVFSETVTCVVKGVASCKEDVQTNAHKILSMVFNSMSPYCAEGCSEISTDFEYLLKCVESFDAAKEGGNEEACREFDKTKACFDQYIAQEKCYALEEYTEAMYQKWQFWADCDAILHDAGSSISPSPSTMAMSDISDEKQKTEVETVIPNCSLDPIITCLGLLTKSFPVVMNPINEKFRELSRQAGKGGEGPEINFRKKEERKRPQRGRGNRRKRQLNLPEGFKLPGGITLPNGGAPPPNNNLNSGPGGFPPGFPPDSECRGPLCPKSTTEATPSKDIITLAPFEDLSPMEMIALKFDRGCGLLENMKNTDNCVNLNTEECDDATTTMVQDTVAMIKGYLLPLCGSDCQDFGRRLLRLKRCKEKMDKNMQGKNKQYLLRTNKFLEMCWKYQETMSCYAQYETEPGWCSHLSNYNNKTRPEWKELFEEDCPEPTTTSTTVKSTPTKTTATTTTSTSRPPSTTTKRTIPEDKPPSTSTNTQISSSSTETPPERDNHVSSTSTAHLPATDSESPKSRTGSVEDRLTELLNISSKNTNSPDKGLEIKAGKGVSGVRCNLAALLSCYNDLSQHFGPFVRPVFYGLASIGGSRHSGGGGGSMSSGSGSGRGSGPSSGRGVFNRRNKRYASEPKIRQRRQLRERPKLPGFGPGQMNSLEGVSVYVPSIGDLSEEDLEEVNFELGCGSLGKDRNDCLAERGERCGEGAISSVNETMLPVEEYLQQFCEEGCEAMASVLAKLDGCTELISRTIKTMRPPDWRRENKVWSVCVQYHYMMECSLPVLETITCPIVFNAAYDIIQPISNRIKDLCEVVLTTTTTTTMSTPTTQLTHSECFTLREQGTRACFNEVKDQLKTMSVTDWRNSKNVAQFCSLHIQMEECLDESEYLSCPELFTFVEGELSSVSSAIGDVCVVIETTTPQPLVTTGSTACVNLDEQKSALDECSIQVGKTLRSIIEEDWENPVMLGLLCAQYKTMLMCQYRIILSDTCADLKVYANESLYTAYFKLTETCDVQLPTEAPHRTATEAMITQPQYCTAYYDYSYSCSQDVDAKLDSYTISDWRQNIKVKAICRDYETFISCQESLLHNTPQDCQEVLHKKISSIADSLGGICEINVQTTTSAYSTVVSTPHEECDTKKKVKLEKCHKTIDDKLGKYQPIEEASKEHVDQMCKAYEKLLQCQYGIILTGLCQDLRHEANFTLSRINIALEGTCDDILADMSTQSIATTELPDITTRPMTTEDQCSDIETRLTPLQNCTKSLWDTIDSFSVADWRDDRKVIDLCQQWTEVPSCVDSISLRDPCLDLILAANQSLRRLEDELSGICSEVTLSETSISDNMMQTTADPVCPREKLELDACVATFSDLTSSLTAAHWRNDTVIEIICREHSTSLTCYDLLTITCNDMQSFADQTLAQFESLLDGICSETTMEATTAIKTTALPIDCLDEDLMNSIKFCSIEVTDSMLLYQEPTETVCRKFDEFIFCQYKILMGSECAPLHEYSQQAFNNVTQLLDGLCEGRSQQTTSGSTTVDPTIGTTKSDCTAFEKKVEDCWMNTTGYYKTLTAMDFRNEMKVDKLCWMLEASVECNASLTSQDGCPAITTFMGVQNSVSKFDDSCIGVHDGITTLLPDVTTESFRTTESSCKLIKEEEKQLTSCSAILMEYIQNTTGVDTLGTNKMKSLCRFYEETILCQYKILVSTECESLNEIAAQQNEEFKEVVQDRCSAEHLGTSGIPDTSTVMDQHSALDEQVTSVKRLESHEETASAITTQYEPKISTSGGQSEPVTFDEGNNDHCPAHCYCSLGCPSKESNSIGNCHAMDGCSNGCSCHLDSDERVNGRCGTFLPVYSCETTAEGPLTTTDPSWCPDECYCALGCEDESDSIGECTPLSSTCPYSCVCHKGADERIHGRCGRFRTKDLC